MTPQQAREAAERAEERIRLLKEYGDACHALGKAEASGMDRVAAVLLIEEAQVKLDALQAHIDILTLAPRPGHVVEWQDIETAPLDGTEVIVLSMLAGRPVCHAAHYTEGGGEEQPRFGPDWFYWNGNMFVDIDRPTHWIPLPALSARPAEQRKGTDVLDAPTRREPR